MEAVLLSISPSYVASLRKEQPVLAKQLEKLKNNIDQPLAAILTLNTIAHTAGAAGGGGGAGGGFFDWERGGVGKRGSIGGWGRHKKKKKRTK